MHYTLCYRVDVSILRFTCAAKSTIEKLNVEKITQFFFADGNFLCSRYKMYVVFMSQILLLLAKYFNSRWKLPKNFLLLFLKAVYQYSFTLVSIFVLRKAF